MRYYTVRRYRLIFTGCDDWVVEHTGNEYSRDIRPHGEGGKEGRKRRPREKGVCVKTGDTAKRMVWGVLDTMCYEKKK